MITSSPTFLSSLNAIARRGPIEAAFPFATIACSKSLHSILPLHNGVRPRPGSVPDSGAFSKGKRCSRRHRDLFHCSFPLFSRNHDRRYVGADSVAAC